MLIFNMNRVEWIIILCLTSGIISCYFKNNILYNYYKDFNKIKILIEVIVFTLINYAIYLGMYIVGETLFVSQYYIKLMLIAYSSFIVGIFGLINNGSGKGYVIIAGYFTSIIIIILDINIKNKIFLPLLLLLILVSSIKYLEKKFQKYFNNQNEKNITKAISIYFWNILILFGVIVISIGNFILLIPIIKKLLSSNYIFSLNEYILFGIYILFSFLLSMYLGKMAVLFRKEVYIPFFFPKRGCFYDQNNIFYLCEIVDKKYNKSHKGYLTSIVYEKNKVRIILKIKNEKLKQKILEYDAIDVEIIGFDEYIIE